ncbi:MAG TPA: hypothetical protein VGJ05_06740 [Fimbriiglobus sp.]|jgi:hypothetical protein
MPIPVRCPKCDAVGDLPNEAAGQQATCPLCQTQFPVPFPAPPPDVAEGYGVWVDTLAAAPVPDYSPAPPPVEPVRILKESPQPADPPLPAPPAEIAVVSDAPGWARAEADQFKAYVTAQLIKLENTRRQIADAESRYEALCVNRSMDLNRVAAGLDARLADLDRRDADGHRAAEALAARSAEVERRVAELADREGAIVARETRRAKLEAEAADLGRLVAELRPVVEKLELRKTEAEALRTELATKQKNLDRRLIEVGRSELAVQKRIAELDETERILQKELEDRELELERQRAVLAEEMRALRARVPVDAQTPMPRSLEGFGSKTPVKALVGIWSESATKNKSPAAIVDPGR